MTSIVFLVFIEASRFLKSHWKEISWWLATCSSQRPEKKKKNCAEITSFSQLLFLGSLRGLQLLSRFEALPDAPHWWARGKGTCRADASAFYVHQNHRVLAKEELTHLGSQALQLQIINVDLVL